MQLKIKEGSENYACTVVKLPVKQKVEGYRERDEQVGEAVIRKFHEKYLKK